MLRRVDNVQVVFTRPRFTFFTKLLKPGTGCRLFIGKQMFSFPSVGEPEWAQILEEQYEIPVQFRVEDLNRTYWWFNDNWHWDNEGLNAEQVHALLVTKQQRRDQQISRAQAMVSMGMRPTQQARQVIPPDVKQYVWQRDAGRCQNCGNTTELQFDHVIPVAWGGATSTENLQLLCGPCNRNKGAGLA